MGKVARKRVKRFSWENYGKINKAEGIINEKRKILECSEQNQAPFTIIHERSFDLIN